MPVASRGRLVGVINLQNRAPHQYNRREISLVSTIGFLVGAEIEMARLETENLQLSRRLETRKIIERAKGILQRRCASVKKTPTSCCNAKAGSAANP